MSRQLQHAQRRPTIGPEIGAGLNSGRELKSFFVFHINRDAPDELHIDAVQAPSGAEARLCAERLFKDSAILQIRHDGDSEAPPEVGGYPSARFIRGKFMGAVFADDEL